MKKTTFSLAKITGIILLSGLILASCKKDKDPQKPDTQSVDDNSEIQSEFDDILSIAEDVMTSNNTDMDKSGTDFTLSDTTCATVSLDTAYADADGAKGKITIDFGTTNCLGADGRSRRGKIFVVYTGRYRTTGTKITTTFENYFVNDNQIQGTKIVEKTNDSTYTVNVTGASISWTDGTTTSWNSTRTRVWTEGRSTLFNLQDDVYVINGTANGTNRLGTDFTATITNVKHKIECWFSKIFYPVSGTIEITPDGAQTRTVDYGDGTCDKTVTITVAGISYDHTFQ